MIIDPVTINPNAPDIFRFNNYYFLKERIEKAPYYKLFNSVTLSGLTRELGVKRVNVVLSPIEKHGIVLKKAMTGTEHVNAYIAC